MGALTDNLMNLDRRGTKLDPLFGGLFRKFQDTVRGPPPAGTNYYGEAPPPLGGPSTDTAANLQNQQTQLRNLQRGVLTNIYAGNTAAPPNVATRTILGG